MDGVFVDVEKKGRSWIIKKTERTKLDNAYLDYLAKLKLTAAPAGGVQSTLTPKQAGETSKPAPAPSTQPAPAPVQPLPQPRMDNSAGIYTVIAARLENRPGSTTHVLLERANKEQIHAFAMGEHPELIANTQLTGVKLSMRQQGAVVYYVLEDYRIAVPDAQAA